MGILPSEVKVCPFSVTPPKATESHRNSINQIQSIDRLEDLCSLTVTDRFRLYKGTGFCGASDFQAKMVCVLYLCVCV